MFIQMRLLTRIEVHMKWQLKGQRCKKQRDEIKEATREINALKTEMQEIKSLLLKLANTP